LSWDGALGGPDPSHSASARPWCQSELDEERLTLVEAHPALGHLDRSGDAVSQRLPSERWYNNSSIYCPRGGSLLRIAAYGAPLETIQLLLENGADTFAEGNNNALPFHSACQAG
jgi:hypothetical protein